MYLCGVENTTPLLKQRALSSEEGNGGRGCSSATVLPTTKRGISIELLPLWRHYVLENDRFFDLGSII